MRTAVITDSTSYLPDGWALTHDVVVVPVQVIVDAHALDETDAEQAADVIAALRAGAQVSTSRPSPARFTAAVEQMSDRGYDEAVIITVSSALSGTYEAACSAATNAPIPVQVVDSRSIGMGLGFPVMAAAAAAQDQADSDVVAARVREQARATDIFFYVDTLEYLRRGGRVASASAFVGQALHVKPILRIVDGHVEPVDRVRTEGKAINRLVELALAGLTGPTHEVAISDLDAAGRADAVAEQVRALVPGISIVRTKIGGVVGAHTGPGIVAITTSPLV